jgi:hypothetical protein
LEVKLKIIAFYKETAITSNTAEKKNDASQLTIENINEKVTKNFKFLLIIFLIF